MKKGSHHTLEAREKCRQARLGRHQTPEAIEKTRQANLGSHRSPETKEKICRARNTPEAIEAVRRVHLGSHRAPEVGEKIRKALLGRHRTPETREKISRANLGRRVTPETRQKLRQIQSTPEVKEKNRQAHLGRPSGMKGRHHTAEAIERNRQAHVGMHHSSETKMKMHLTHSRPEMRARQREIAKRLQKDPEYMKKLQAGLRSKTRPEKKVHIYLDSLCPKKYGYNGQGQLGAFIDGLTPDFVRLDSLMQVIEVFGSYSRFHQLSDEREKRERYAKQGYSCLIIWDYELKDEKAVVQKIIDFVGQEPHLYFNQSQPEGVPT
jgi:hypothetical protein